MQEIVIIGKDLDKQGIYKALDTCLMSSNEIITYQIMKAIERVSLKDLVNEYQEFMVDEQGEKYISTSNIKNGLNDPFPKWLQPTKTLL